LTVLAVVQIASTVKIVSIALRSWWPTRSPAPTQTRPSRRRRRWRLATWPAGPCGPAGPCVVPSARSGHRGFRV